MKETGIAIYERANITGAGYRRTVDEHDVATHTEGWHRESHLYGFLSGRGLRHERGAGEDLGTVKLENGSIDSGCDSEVICIHNQTGHVK